MVGYLPFALKNISQYMATIDKHHGLHFVYMYVCHTVSIYCSFVNLTYVMIVFVCVF